MYVCIYNYIQYHPVTCLDIKKVRSSSLHACYQQITAYTSTLKERLCARSDYGEAYVYLSNDPASCQKNPRTLQNKKPPKFEHQLLRENHTAKKHDS